MPPPPPPRPRRQGGPGRPFQKGSGGNPKGRTPGSQNKLTAIVRALVTPAAPKIVAKIIEQAEANDPAAQKIFVQHLLPQPKFVDPPILDFPLVTNAKEAVAEIAQTTQRMTHGEIDVDAAHAIVDKLKTFIVGYAAVELEAEVFKAKLRDMGGEEP
jgi:hypothetical protein